MNKYDNRCSGRTTKMLMAALKYAKTGGTAIVVIENPDVIRNLVVKLISQDYGGIYNAPLSKYTPASGGPIYFMPMKNEAVNLKTLCVHSCNPEGVFWDHEVVRLAHNRIIQEFHRYD